MAYIYSTEHYKSNFDQGQFVLVHKSASANYSSAVENFWGQNKIGNASLSIQIIIGNHFCLVQKEAFFLLSFFFWFFFLVENLRSTWGRHPYEVAIKYLFLAGRCMSDRGLIFIQQKRVYSESFFTPWPSCYHCFDRSFWRNHSFKNYISLKPLPQTR